MRKFADLVDIAARGGKEGLRPVIEKEILHYDILFALDKSNLLDGLVFQGGTSLRLCYGSHRFSEDLDFVGGVAFTNSQLMDIRECIMDHIASRYGLEIQVKSPKEMRLEPNYFGLEVDRWQVTVVTNPGRTDLPKQKIKLEVANVPAHTKTLRALERNYDFLPASYSDLLVPVETLDEILADKIVSLSSCRTHVRHRDIWDLQWLAQKGAKLIPDLVLKKAQDYKSKSFETDLVDMIEGVKSVVLSEDFNKEMVRFIAPDVRARTFEKPGFNTYLGQRVSDLLLESARAVFPELQPEKEEEPFQL